MRLINILPLLALATHVSAAPPTSSLRRFFLPPRAAQGDTAPSVEMTEASAHSGHTPPPATGGPHFVTLNDVLSSPARQQAAPNAGAAGEGSSSGLSRRQKVAYVAISTGVAGLVGVLACGWNHKCRKALKFRNTDYKSQPQPTAVPGKGNNDDEPGAAYLQPGLNW